jgi:hypothetical protein
MLYSPSILHSENNLWYLKSYLKATLSDIAEARASLQILRASEHFRLSGLDRQELQSLVAQINKDLAFVERHSH